MIPAAISRVIRPRSTAPNRDKLAGKMGLSPPAYVCEGKGVHVLCKLRCMHVHVFIHVHV